MILLEEVPSSDEIRATCGTRVGDAFSSQAHSRECIRLSFLAIALSKSLIEQVLATRRASTF